MRRSLWTVLLAFGLLVAMALPASSADLHRDHVGTSLKCTTSEIAVWHFVNNKTEGATEVGVLTVTFSDGSTVAVRADEDGGKVLRNTQHFYVRGPDGEIQSASTGLEGMLVLSDYECVKKGAR